MQSLTQGKEATQLDTELPFIFLCHPPCGNDFLKDIQIETRLKGVDTEDPSYVLDTETQPTLVSVVQTWKLYFSASLAQTQ